MVFFVKNVLVICVISVVYVSSLEVKILVIFKMNKIYFFDIFNEVINNCFLFFFGEMNLIWIGILWEKINN